MDQTLLLAGLFLAVAVLYSSVGHAGASGYLAAMALVGLAPATMKPTALALNILVAAIVTTRFHLAGYVRWRALAPFLVASVPLAFLGGAITLPAALYKPLVGLVLLAASVRLFATASALATRPDREPSVPLWLALPIGGALGLLAGLTGTGGGIFLTPLVLFAGWAGPRFAGGLSSGFILANSVSGLAGNVAAVQAVPSAIPVWLATVAIGGLIGAELGARRFGTAQLRRALALVLVVAGLKLIFLG